MHSELYKKIFEKKWPSELGAVILALLSILIFLYSSPLGGVQAAISDWGIWIYNITFLDTPKTGAELVPPLTNRRNILISGFIIGVFLSAVLAGQFKIRKEGSYIQGFAGGALMGIGGFLVGGCNVGAFYSSVMALSLSGFIMMAGLLIGAYLGGKFMVWQIDRQAEKLFNADTGHISSSSKKDIKKDNKLLYIRLALIVGLITVSMASFLIIKEKIFVVTILLFGLLFGIVFQRAAFCFTAAFREIFITKSTRMMRSLLLSLIIGIAGFSIIKATGIKPTNIFVWRTGLPVLVGGVIFGFGMTITGG